MNVFKGIFIALFSFISSIALIVMLIRLSNGESPFVSFSTIYYYLQSVDLLKPFKEMVNNLSKQVTNFNNSLADFGSINNIGDFFRVTGMFFVNLMTLISFPIQLIYYIVKFFIILFGEIARFLNVVCGTDFDFFTF